MPSPPLNSGIQILFHHEGILVVEKPVGLPSQSTKDKRESLYSLLQQQFDYVGLHHRLDTPASGLLLLTTHRSCNAAISSEFRAHNIQRSYRIVVVGDPGPGGLWATPLDEKSATTHWRKVGTVEGMSTLVVRLESGRTHQIRRHALEHGYPIVGDRRYGGAAAKLWHRLALHAETLGFRHPSTGEHLTFDSPIPSSLEGLAIPGCSPTP